MIAPIEVPSAVLERAFLFLKGRCDGAQALDHVGFNAWDAQWSDRELDRVERGAGFSNVESAHRILTKYRKQLDGGGIALPPLEVVVAGVEAAKPVGRNVTDGGQVCGSSAPVVTVSKPNGQPNLAVQFSYDPALVAKVKAIPGRYFDGTNKRWLVPEHELPRILETFPDARMIGVDVQAARAQADALARETAAAVEVGHRAELALSGRIASDLERLNRIFATIERTPFEHQASGIRWLIEQRRALLADDMGLGKTYQALVAARAVNEHIIVVAPAGLRLNWLREAEAVNARIEVHSWAKVPTVPKGKRYTLIVDEAHYAQNLKAARTTKMLALAAGAECCFLLTGTPIKNGRPTNLFPLLVAIRHEVAKDRRHYERHFCNAGPTRWTRWDVTGAAHLEELHATIADRLLRRMKDEVLDLPEKMRVKREAEFTIDARARYEVAFESARGQYKARIAAGEASSEGEALVMLGIVRKASSIGKVETAIEIAEELIENGQSVVLFTAFVESAKALAQQLGAGLITGEQSAETRQAFIDSFQAGELPAMVCTLGAGNVGITLTKAQTVIMVDRPWTPGDAVQAEDRLHRIGQRNAVTSVWLRYGEVDVWLDDEVLEMKQQRANVVLTGNAGDSLIAARPSAAKFVATLFGGDA